jgi:hypothetical protein
MSGYLPQNRGNKTVHRTGSTVSRRLRAAGFNISPSARKHLYSGMFVSAAEDYASVLFDLGDEMRNREASAEVYQLVGTWERVSRLDVSVLEDGRARVTFILGR